MKKNVLPFLVIAALPAVGLCLLALLGARAEVGVVMTGSGANAVLGGAWVACWLASLVISPIALGAAALSLALGLPGAARPTPRFDSDP